MKLSLSLFTVLFALACLSFTSTSAATLRISKDNILPTPRDRRLSARRVKKYLRNQGTPRSPLIPESDTTKKPSIIGGYDAGNDTSPYLAIVDVYLKSGLGAVCTGTIISRDRVLTAAHCFLNDNYELTDVSSVFIWAGVRQLSDLNSDSYPLFYRAYTAHVDNRYTGDGLNWDVGLVTITTYFPDGYPTAMISEKSLRNKDKVYAAGYGIIDTETDELPAMVQEVKLKARKFRKCRKFEEARLQSIFVKRTMQCASSPKFKKGGKDTCSGDSGGPLYRKVMVEKPVDDDDEMPESTPSMDDDDSMKNTTQMVVYGVTSFGSGCARPKTGAWYMKMSFFYENIMAHLALGDNAMDAEPKMWHLVLDDSAQSPFQ